MDIISEFRAHLVDKSFPCVAAHDIASRDSIRCMVSSHMMCAADDPLILSFLYSFIDEYRNSENGFLSAAILFRGPVHSDEEQFESMMWRKLQALADLDAMHYGYDPRVSRDPESPNFSYSLKEEAFYIIGLHPGSMRRSRQYKLPALVFNPHAQFEKLREHHQYDKMKRIVRKRDVLYSGSVNPMLTDFGESSEALQYSGMMHDKNWKCPLQLKHGNTQHHSPS